MYVLDGKILYNITTIRHIRLNVKVLANHPIQGIIKKNSAQSPKWRVSPTLYHYAQGKSKKDKGKCLWFLAFNNILIGRRIAILLRLSLRVF